MKLPVKYPKALAVSVAFGFAFLGLMFLLKYFGLEGTMPVQDPNSTMPFWLR